MIRTRRRADSLIALAALMLVGPFLALPVFAIADEWRAPSLFPQRLGLRAVRAVLDDAVLGDAIVNSLVVGLGAAVVGLVVAWPAARALAQPGAPRWPLAVILFPILLPALAIGDGLRVWFLRVGLADGLIGLVVAHLVFVVPYMVLVLIPGFTTELRRQEEASKMLAGNAVATLKDVTAPILAGRIGLAVALGFTVSWSQYGTSLGVGGGVPTLPIVLVPFVRADPQVAAVLDLIFLAPPLLVFFVALRAGPDATA